MVLEDMKAARVAAGLTAAELGKRLGVSGSYIARVEKGERRYPTGLLAQWLDALKVFGDSRKELARTVVPAVVLREVL
ncbi:MAG: helix-turn-helix transcriptional regulator [bacterium]|nr:helix-turn-helix transcriptional regulator [bacterium]